MTPELIKQLAEEAGFGELLADGVIQPSELEAFAALVAAYQRELEARLCEGLLEKIGAWSQMDGEYSGITGCAAAIRERKE